MQKPLSCSFHSSQPPIPPSQLSSRQQSILREYNKIMTDSSIQYSQQTLPYSQLPKFATLELRNGYSQCVYLDKFTFYEMFTMLIVEYLFKEGSEGGRARRRVDHLRGLVYQGDFLEGSLFTKGLIVKGLKTVEEMAKQKECSQPLGNCLLNCDSICAFTQLWKQLVLKICEQNNMPNINENEIDSSIFQLFASYFHVNFDVYWKEKNNKLWKQHFTYQDANANTDTLAVIVNPEYQISVSQRSIKVSESRASGNSSSNNNNKSNNCWNYLILTNPVPMHVEKMQGGEVAMAMRQEKNMKGSTHSSHKAQLPNGEEISRISEIEYSCGQTQQIKQLLQQKISQSQTEKKVGKLRKQHLFAEEALSNILGTMSKANYLIQEMRKYSEFLESVEVPCLDFMSEEFSAQ